MKALDRRGSQLRACCLGYDHQLGELSFEGARPVRHCKTQAQLKPDRECPQRPGRAGHEVNKSRKLQSRAAWHKEILTCLGDYKGDWEITKRASRHGEGGVLA